MQIYQSYKAKWAVTKEIIIPYAIVGIISRLGSKK